MAMSIKYSNYYELDIDWNKEIITSDKNRNGFKDLFQRMVK